MLGMLGMLSMSTVQQASWDRTSAAGRLDWPLWLSLYGLWGTE